ncbi:protein unc-93 A [Biomphalaria glabrata]|nr:protein unc-93 A [Biomphalaria glabrata]
MATCKEKAAASANSSPGPRERFLLTPPPCDSAHSLDWADGTHNKNRRRSTIHSYTIAVYHTLPKNAKAMKEVRAMTSSKAAKNLLSISLAFMFIYTGFVSLQSLHSSIHPQGGLGVVSLSIIYGTTVLSCLMAPWLINRLTTKWTMVLAFSLFTAYFAANFYPRHFIIIPLSVILGALAGPMWSAQATYVTTLALTYAQHKRIIFESDDVINQFMGVFFGFYRCSQIWGNIISTLILSRNETDANPNSTVDIRDDVFSDFNSTLSFFPYVALNQQQFDNASSGQPLSPVDVRQCGAKICPYLEAGASTAADGTYSNDVADLGAIIADSTRYMLLTTYLACGVMAAVVIVSLLDEIHIGKTEADPEFSQSSWELCLSTVKMLKDTKCLLLMPMVVFVGLEQGFMFGDFTKVGHSSFQCDCHVMIAKLSLWTSVASFCNSVGV